MAGVFLKNWMKTIRGYPNTTILWVRCLYWKKFVARKKKFLSLQMSQNTFRNCFIFENTQYSPKYKQIFNPNPKTSPQASFLCHTWPSKRILIVQVTSAKYIEWKRFYTSCWPFENLKFYQLRSPHTHNLAFSRVSSVFTCDKY